MFCLTNLPQKNLYRLDKIWLEKLDEVRKETSSIRKSMKAEHQCNQKTSIHSIASLEKIKNAKREQIQKCEGYFKDMNNEIDKLRNYIKELKLQMKDYSLEKELIEQFHTLFEGELQQSREEAEFRRRSRWAIVKIQSVWRGVMVRKGLGRYKVLKKRRKKSGQKSSKL